jgi:hypothetical protein
MIDVFTNGLCRTRSIRRHTRLGLCGLSWKESRSGKETGPVVAIGNTTSGTVLLRNT